MSLGWRCRFPGSSARTLSAATSAASTAISILSYPYRSSGRDEERSSGSSDVKEEARYGLLCVNPYSVPFPVGAPCAELTAFHPGIATSTPSTEIRPERPMKAYAV